MLWGEVTSVLTSATIPPRIVERVGLRRSRPRSSTWGARSTTAPTPCSTSPAICPDRRAAGAEEALHEELSQFLEAAGGRTLALFTSRRATEAAAAALAPESPYPCSCRVISPRACCSRNSPRTRPPACSPRMGFWQGWTSRAGPSRW